MIQVDFFGCKKEQILACSWEQACDRFAFTGIAIPDVAALFSLNEVLTGDSAYPAEAVASSTEPFQELCESVQAAVRKAAEEDLKDAAARWAQSPPWSQRDTNPMDLAGFLLDLRSLVHGPGREGNLIFLWVEAGGLSWPANNGHDGAC